ncbi:hypothetical protein NDU88_007084 [Pleurodeles waltl]|uniref:Uncharacterized protein n=1 Tax=Pleurodeles waltl TaxID=8319 RepID=A0AAV7N2S0_PLEWA|nr:hypothetical protein NDU88_007084 [Pleurodeles waltl]
MGKDRANEGTQQIRMAQYTAESSGASLQKDPPGPLERGADPTGARILAAIESSSHAMQTQIAAIAVDVNLLRDDLRVVAERSVATEQQVTCMQSDMDTLKASVAILKAKTRKLEARVEDAEGNPEYKKDLQGVINGYFSANWDTATTRGKEWEALKVVIRGLSKTYGIRKRLVLELTQQEDALAAIQHQVDNGDASESDYLEGDSIGQTNENVDTQENDETDHDVIS